MTESRLTTEGELDPETRRELISASVDRELTDEERARLAALLAQSAEARRELDELEHIAKAMEELVHRAPPMHLLPTIERLAQTRSRPAPGPLARWAAAALRPLGTSFAARLELEGRTRAYVGAPHGRLALLVGACLGAAPVVAAGIAPSAIASTLAALALAWVASLRTEERWRARTLILAMMLGAALPLAVERTTPSSTTAPLALAAAAVALAVLQAGARSRAGDGSWPALAIQAVLACACARPDVVGALALVVPASGLAGGALAMLDRERPRASGTGHEPESATFPSGR